MSTKPARKILVCDDDESLRCLVVMCLEAQLAEPVTILEAPDGDSALAMLQAEPGIALVISDGRMGDGLDGLGLLKRLQAREVPVPFILFSGEGEYNVEAPRLDRIS